jgi:putative tricarboxylic transport membrane protein
MRQEEAFAIKALCLARGGSARESDVSKERGGSYIFLIAGIYGLIYSLKLPFGRWNEPGAGVFPLALSILLLASGLFWFFQGKKREGKKETGVYKAFSRKYSVPLQIIVLTAGFILALAPLGYLLTSTVYIFILFLWVSRYRVWTAAGLAIVIGAGSWLFFEKLLATSLPTGFFPL